jgi:hypothetical protein
MQTSYWFSVEEKLPANSGLYLACGMYSNKPYPKMVPSLYFWNVEESNWFRKDEKTPLKNLKIIYWTMSDLYIWHEFDYPSSTPILNVASMSALQEVREAIDKFNFLKNLSNNNKE